MQRSFYLLILILFIGGIAVVSCTTSDKEGENEQVEKELNSELDDLEDKQGDVATSEDDELDGLDEENPSTKKSSDKQKTAGSSDSEDDEFLAEDSDSPTPTTAASSALAENDLKKELQAGGAPPQSNPPSEPLFPDESATTDTAASTGRQSSSKVTSRETNPKWDDLDTINPETPKEDLGVSDPLVANVESPLPSVRMAKEVVPVSKIGKDPFYRNERLMNTVYITRPGDDLGSVSQKIFGEDRTSQLLADNPHISKGFDPGDKIYYTSPHRPDDKKTILTYFEDLKTAPKYYTTKKGDDIHRIGRQLLGYDDAWKEVWATNDSLQTQALLPEGLRIKYWTGTEPQSATLSKEPPLPPVAEVAVAPKRQEVLIEPPADPLPAATGTIAGSDPAMEAPTEGLPAMSPSESLPTVPKVEAKQENSLMTVAALALIGIAVLVLVAIQIKNRKKQTEQAMPPSLEFTKV